MYQWIAQFSSGALAMPRREQKKNKILAEAVQEQLRSEHARRLDFIYHQAEEAWSASRAAQRASSLAKLRQALRADYFAAIPLDEEVIDKLLGLVDALFARHQHGDPRFLEKMLSALADERRMWDANLCGKKPLPAPEETNDDESNLTDAERGLLLRQLFDEAQTKHDAVLAAGGADSAAATR